MNEIHKLAYFHGKVIIGEKNKVGAYTVIGTPAEHKNYYINDIEGKVIIGNNNIIRELITINASYSDEATTIGNNCFITAHSHIGHDCHVGDNVVLAKATLGGHTKVHSFAFMGLNSATHQFTTIGAFSLVGGGSFVTKDIPPFLIYIDKKGCYRINRIGLERAGIEEGKIGSVYRYYITQDIDNLDKDLQIFVEDFKRESKRPNAKIGIEE
ncbi:hypothetical protein LCGC14_0454290 [marine sediment metagenome]|uniref:UDP N-acetylglucosamine O-acyltransferase C-terminal domain-containing protein n=1 Tax=marine sediment metagenome TaxID=412755 RepID=A0A0F9SM65_9ZZZZ